MHKSVRHVVVGVAAFGTALATAACAHRTTTPTASEQVSAQAPSQQQPAATNLLADFASFASDRIYFETDQFNLTPNARHGLERQAEWLQRHREIHILIAGNCDERGTRDYNLALGSRRAAAARDYLISLGIAPARIQATSNGKDRPLDTRANEDGWAVNRNAHTQLLNAPAS